MNQKKAYKKFVKETKWLCNNLYREDISDYGCISANFYDMFVRRVASAMHVNSIYDIP